jgi:hypothetical protein
MSKPLRTQMQVGLGEAILRQNRLQTLITNGIASQDEREEYKLLADALNEIKLDLGFDCNEDGIPDTIEIFHQTAKTSCCRFVPGSEKPKPKKRKRSNSRSKR